MIESFAELGLRPASRRALEAQGITTPTPIQSAALRPLLAGRDVIGQARTGSGKTLAFALPLMEQLDPAVRRVQALVLVPTRELAVQVAGVIEELAGRGGPQVTTLFGGRAFGPQVAALRGATIVVGTPGRTLDHLRQETLSLRAVTYLVLDEADEMLDRGFAPDVERILRHVPRARQTTLFSATVAEWVHQIAAKHLDNPLTIRVEPTSDIAGEPVEELVYDLGHLDKQAVLETLLDRRGPGSVVVFGRTKHGVMKLGKRLAAKGFPVATLHGNLSQNARDRAMADFRGGRMPILVATNVAARGIDVSDVGQVINFELPESAGLFTHRVGRTGRMGRAGQAITLLSPSDADQWRKIERDLGRRLPRRRWDEPLSVDSTPIPAPVTGAVMAAPAAPARRNDGRADARPSGHGGGQRSWRPRRAGRGAR